MTRFAQYDDERTVIAFHVSEIADPPEGAQVVEITEAEHIMLLEGASKGARPFIDDDGKPALADPPEGS
jgi:hypothetical protein